MRDERAKKVGLYGSLGATNCQFAAAVGNDKILKYIVDEIIRDRL
jgi:hypothetical protein